MMREFNVAACDSLAVGAVRSVEVQGRRLAVAHLADGFFAIDDACPHRGTPLGAGFMKDCVVHCPQHGWGFDLRTGACDVRPDKPVGTHPVTVRDGHVWVSLESAT